MQSYGMCTVCVVAVHVGVLEAAAAATPSPSAYPATLSLPLSSHLNPHSTRPSPPPP